MKKMLSLFCAAGILLLHMGGIPVSAEDPSTGKCGDNITWHYDADTASLTLTGTGAMYDYEDWLIDTPSEYTPWQSLDIQQLTVSEGIETIGNFAFYACTSLSSVSLPDSLRRIGDNAFSKCEKLKSVSISKRVTSIGSYAFSDCHSLESMEIPDSATCIEAAAFKNCDSLLSRTDSS